MTRTFTLPVLAVAALAAACDSIECGTGTHEEGGACVPDVPVCSCGPGTAAVSTDGGCRCELVPPTCGPATTWDGDAGMCVPTPPLPGACICACMNRPFMQCGIMLPGLCVAEVDRPNQVLATVADGAGGYSLVGGYGAAVPVTGGITEVHGLQHQLTLDGQPAHVPLAVEADGSFATDAGARLLGWEMLIPDQPALPVRGVSVTGFLDMDGRPHGSGRIVGCITLEDAAAVYLEVLGQTLADVIENTQGIVPDCDATGSGFLADYTLDLSWWSGEAVDVVD